jgi:hypothetical protein
LRSSAGMVADISQSASTRSLWDDRIFTVTLPTLIRLG